MNIDRPGACARAYSGADRRALTTAGYRSNHRADCGANARARHGAAGDVLMLLRKACVRVSIRWRILFRVVSRMFVR